MPAGRAAGGIPFDAPAGYMRPALPETDEALFKQVQAGGRDAFAVLVERHQRRAYAVALRLLGGSQDAEDAVQQAFLRLYESRARYDSRWRLSTWFYRILTNVCVDELRRRRPMLPLPGTDVPAMDAPDRDLEAAERDRLLRRALAEVPVEARIALTLYYGDGRSYRDIGAIRGVTVNTVKTHLRRGRLALRKALRAQGLAGP
ncbi:MAG TPA: sigma-70 family RNA polymerase sigma factor [Candidatus Acidoferrum sp.]|nr:sigma-70 family RNA polymerase sigma factor [Candidatus Acidoferrum sp.]